MMKTEKEDLRPYRKLGLTLLQLMGLLMIVGALGELIVTYFF